MKNSFSKAQIAAVVAGIVDFGTLTFWMECRFAGGVVAATAIGAFLGAVTNFLMNRYRSFEGAADRMMGPQALKYFFVSAGSLALNTAGVYLLTEKLNTYYLLSKTIIAIAVSVFYNYPLHRYFVYQKPREA